MSSTIAAATRTAIVRALCFALLALILPSRLFAATVTIKVDPSGTITEGDKKVNQATIYIRAANSSGQWTWDPKAEFPQSDNTGAYKYTTAPTIKSVGIYTAAPNANKVLVEVIAKKLSVAQGVVTIKYGTKSGYYPNPGNNNTITLMTHDIDLSNTYTYANPLQKLALANAGILVDPGYTFTVSNPALHTGLITFTEDLSFGDGPAMVVGLARYTDGSTAVQDGASENVFGEYFSIDPIAVLGIDANGHGIMSGGGVRILDENGIPFMSGNLTNIIADPNPLNPKFEGTISNLQLGSASLNSRLINEWTSGQFSGKTLKLVLDPELMYRSTFFSHDAQLQGYAAIGSPVPEPGCLILALALLPAACLLRRRVA